MTVVHLLSRSQDLKVELLSLGQDPGAERPHPSLGRLLHSLLTVQSGDDVVVQDHVGRRVHPRAGAPHVRPKGERAIKNSS